jgi:C-methyltransferase-like protein/putative zinc binding protein/methyltransferase family protein
LHQPVHGGKQKLINRYKLENMKNTTCMNCRSSRLERILDMGNQPNGNFFPTYNELDSEPTFPFVMTVCQDCWQVQIEEFPSVELMFSNHPYITGVNMPVVSHFEQMAEDAIKKYGITKNSLVIDIGANDGTLLSKFRDRGMRILGVDPGERTGKLAKEKGVTVCETFWNEDSAGALKQLNILPDLITATAVFYHVADIHSFVKGLAKLMGEKTIFLTQCVYLKDVIEKVQFDHFYHEHTMIHALAPLEKLFSQYGLRMLDVDFYPVHGGSFVLYVGREESMYETTSKVAEAIAVEKNVGLQDLETYITFSKRVEKNRDDLLVLLKKLVGEGNKIFALGAPLKGSTLLNYYNIGTDLIGCATEINRFKIGRFMPGSHIPIVFEDSIETQPNYYLVLSWNFIDFFIEKYADYLKAGGKFIVPHPVVRVIGKEALD